MGGVHSRRRHPKQDSQIQYETVLLNQQVAQLQAEIMRLEALVEDQGERIRRFMKNDHRAFPDELHSNPMFVDAKMMNS
jgi:hypothetical protein